MRYDLLKILVIDDNAHIRMMMGEILKALGVRDIFEAQDGGDGLEMVRREPIDIVMTDLAMRPMDGIEFTRRLRTDRNSPNPLLPVIMITGYSTLVRVNAARDAGVNEFISKPLTARSVIDRINRVVQHPRPFVRSMTYFGPDRRRRTDPNYAGPWRRSADPQRTQSAIEL